MATEIEQIVNQALIEIGFPERIGSIFEGSPASIAALEVYGQTRDELLDAGEWPLARRANIPLTLLKGPPPAGGYSPATPWTAQYPPMGWLYAYAYPDDMLDLRAVRPPPLAMFDLDPDAWLWRVDNDNSLVTRTGAVTVQTKVILTNAPNAIAIYIGQVTDPNLWEPGFSKVVIQSLAKKLARRLLRDETLYRDETAAEAGAEPKAEQARG